MRNYLTNIISILIVSTTVIVFMASPIKGQDSISNTKEISYIKDTYTYKTVDGHEIQADVHRYPMKEVRPALIWIHGGALILGSRTWLTSAQLELYLHAGYTVISIDYRLAPETKLAAIIKDIEDAYAWVRTKGPNLFYIDADRIAVIGHSAGGYLTLMAGFRLKPRPKALVSFYGYGDITGDWYSQPDSFYNQKPTISKEEAFKSVGDSIISNTLTESLLKERAQFYFYCRQHGLWPREVSGHNPETELTWFSKYEPLRNVSPEYPPTMLLHGEEDTDVPFEQSFLMTEAFKRHGVEHEFLTRPDWGHGFDDAGMKDSAVQEAFKRVLSFLKKHVK